METGQSDTTGVVMAPTTPKGDRLAKMLSNKEALTILEECLTAGGFAVSGPGIFVALAKGVTVEVTNDDILVSVDTRDSEDVDAIMASIFAQSLSLSNPVTCAQHLGENLLRHLTSTTELVDSEG